MQRARLLQHFNLNHCSVSQSILSRFLLPTPGLLVTSRVTLESCVTSLALTFLVSEGRGVVSAACHVASVGDEARGSLNMKATPGARSPARAVTRHVFP